MIKINREKGGKKALELLILGINSPVALETRKYNE